MNDVRNAQETFNHLWLETHFHMGKKNLQIFSLFPDKPAGSTEFSRNAILEKPELVIVCQK